MNDATLIGQPLRMVDTPALLLHAPSLRANLERMAGYFGDRHAKLRPHFKSHKCTTLAKHQIEAGAVGITCAKLGEAEVLADSGIQNILIANQIVGPVKIKRLVELARRAKPIVAVDSAENLKMIASASSAAAVSIGIFIEVNIGMNRCGVAPGEAALALARLAHSLPGVSFLGLQGYEGHIVDLRDENERAQKVSAALTPLIETRQLIEAAGIPVKIVSGGGTGTYTMTGNTQGIDEIQAGSYAAMDWYYGEIRPEFKQAQSILSTVISRPTPQLAILDVGRKGIGGEFGPPRVKDLPRAKVQGFGSEEHMSIALPAGTALQVGDQVEVIPSHGCTTCNLYREYVIHENGVVTEIWPIEGSGKLQ